MKKRCLIPTLLLLLLLSGCAGTAEAPAAVPVLSETYSPPPTATPTPTPAPSPIPTPAPTPVPSPEPNGQLDRRTAWMEGADIDAAWADYGGDGFAEIMLRLLYQYGLTPAAACGIAANMWYESSFRPDACSVDGSYGLCQWLGTRRDGLRSWCGAQDYDADTAEGQIAYMMHELESYSVALTGSARECAESFCRVYEVPPNGQMQAKLRGDYAEALYERFFGE